MKNAITDEEKFVTDIRKFLKKVGISSQQEIERAVRAAVESGRLSGDEQLSVQMTLELGELDVKVRIDGHIALA